MNQIQWDFGSENNKKNALFTAHETEKKYIANEEPKIAIIIK
jgi:hypothetical protein